MRSNLITLAASLFACLIPFVRPALADDPAGERPTDAQGKALNLDFETGTLRDWKAEGEAFSGQPIEGDTVFPRRSDSRSLHQGRYWIGGFEKLGDRPQGTLTSVPFKVTHPFASFRIAGGPNPETRVEILRADTGKVIYSLNGDQSETLKPVAVDLSEHQGKEIAIRLVDQDPGPWGHISFDDFRFHTSKPPYPAKLGVMPPDVYAHAGLSPEEAAKAMTVPPGFKVTLFAGEPDVVQPIAMTIDDRGRVWVAEAYSYPRRVPDAEAKDRILIFEDSDNDGRFDKRTVFADKLNLVSGIEVGHGGVWVGAAPHFMFIADKDGNDKPDGPPQILLDGWGMHDTHETLNSFIWGPDGWLYGCHGVFTHSRVGKPGTPDGQRVPINAGVWRYHPTKHVFEVFAHGTSNPWGVDFDSHGQCFIEACVIPHLYHMVQGGRYERQGGAHFNPYTYDDIKTIADHRHYVGANPHGGNGRSDSAGGGHAHSGLMIYNGGAWPDEYKGSLFMNNIHGARLNRDVVAPKGSGFVGSHRPDFLLANDVWSQVVYFRAGPDGNVYMIDWYDKNQCHRNETEVHDRTNGRIFKISYTAAKQAPAALIGTLSADELLDSPNEWRVRQALRRLAEGSLSITNGDALHTELARAKTDPNDRAAFAKMEQRCLRALWALNASRGLSEEDRAAAFSNPSPYVRAWTIQLSCEANEPSAAVFAKMSELAKSDPSPVVRLYLASAMQRLPLEKRWGIVEALLAHEEDVDDPNLPLMYWYAAEPLATLDMSRAARLAAESRFPLIQSFMVRRLGAIGTPEAIAIVVDEMGRAKSANVRRSLLLSLNEALKGRRQVPMPKAWPKVYEALAAANDADIRSQATALGLTFGDSGALKSLRAVLADRNVDAPIRLEALAALLKARDSELPATLQNLLSEGNLRAAALRGLAVYDDAKTPAAVLAIYKNLTQAEKRDALNTLAARPAFARALLAAVGKKDIAATDLTADLIRQLRTLKDASLDALIAQVWGNVRETSADKAKVIAEYKKTLSAKPAQPPDVHLGRTIFSKTCQQCHVLFGTGGRVGPEITGSNRADLEYILSNVLDPSALVGKDYQAHTVAVSDGRVLTGLIKSEDKDAITLVTANETLTVPKSDVEERKLSEQSMMPEDQLKPMSDHEVRSLIAYLASPNQVPMLATAENAKEFFNGKDLTGWVGDANLWSVSNGEIVGKTSGLKRNEFLRSELLVGDFKLNLKIKLANNEGNSGIQFRSEPLPDGEMKGLQADVGQGWWGKLYDENGRGLVWDKSGEAHVKNGEWNDYEVVAIGAKIQTRINGHLCVDFDDPTGARRGIIAFQLHSGGPTEVRFKDIRLSLDPPKN